MIVKRRSTICSNQPIKNPLAFKRCLKTVGRNVYQTGDRLPKFCEITPHLTEKYFRRNQIVARGLAFGNRSEPIGRATASVIGEPSTFTRGLVEKDHQYGSHSKRWILLGAMKVARLWWSQTTSYAFVCMRARTCE